MTSAEAVTSFAGLTTVPFSVNTSLNFLM